MTGEPFAPPFRFYPGRRYTLHMKDGHVLAGRCSVGGTGQVWLQHPYGAHVVHDMSGVVWIENRDHDPPLPPKH